MARPQAILRNRLFVPAKHVKPEHTKPFEYPYEFKDYDPTKAFGDDLGYDFQLIQTYQISPDGDWYGFNRGDLEKIEHLFGDDFRIKDERANVPLGFHLRMRGGEEGAKFSYREGQTEALRDWLDPNLGGILKAPPAFGKTVVAVAYIVAQGQRAVFIADQTNLLDQFEKEFRAFTNIDELEDALGRRLLGPVNKRLGDNVCPISYAPYQYFFANPKYLRMIKNQFGVAIFDEVHVVGAKYFSRAATSLNPLVRAGMTATPYRKDGLHFLFDDLIGPVRHEAERNVGTIARIVYTGCKLSANMRNFNNILNYLMVDESRNNVIAKEVKKAILAGHKVIVLVSRKAHCRDLAELMRKKYKIRAESLNGDNKWQIDDFKQRITSGELTCLVATEKLFGKGFNLPALSLLCITIPSANPANIEQWTGRVERRVPGKQTPVVVYLADSGPNVIYGCVNTVKKAFKNLSIPVTIDTTYSDIDSEVGAVTKRLGTWKKKRSIDWANKNIRDFD